MSSRPFWIALLQPAERQLYTTPVTPPVVDDLFTETDFTASNELLDVHVGLLGERFVAQTTSVPKMSAFVNQLAFPGGLSHYHSDKIPASANYRVELTVPILSTASGAAGPSWRASAAGAHRGYQLLYNQNVTPAEVQLWVDDAGVDGEELIGRWVVSPPYGVGDVPALVGGAEGSTQVGYVDGVRRITVSDTRITEVGRAGMRSQAANTTLRGDLFRGNNALLEVGIAPNGRPIANANGPYAADTGAAITFRSTGSGDPEAAALTYFWRFPDGRISTLANPTLSFATAIAGQVEITVTDPLGACDVQRTSLVVTVPGGGPPPIDPPGPGGSTGVALLPQEVVDTTLPAVTGATWVAGSDSAFRSALVSAALGDQIVVTAAVQFDKGSRPYVLPKKAGTGWITIRSSRSGELPYGVRVSPADAPKMPRFRETTAGTGYVFQCEDGAHHYRIIGLEVTMAATTSTGGKLAAIQLVSIAAPDQYTIADIVHHIILDRCYIHGTPNNNLRRGVALDGKFCAVINCFVSDCHESGGTDSQAVAVLTGGGPKLIENNYLEAASENFLTGGGSARTVEHQPRDITFRRNHCYKPLEWGQGTWPVKNSFEIKNGRRVLVEGNVFENNWLSGQAGMSIVLKPVNQNGTTGGNLATAEDIVFRRNILRGEGGGIDVLWMQAGTVGTTRYFVDRGMHDCHVYDNVIEPIDDPFISTSNKCLRLGAGVDNVVIENNTWISGPSGACYFIQYKLIGRTETNKIDVIFRSNIIPKTSGVGVQGDCGDKSSPCSCIEGTPSIECWCRGPNASAKWYRNMFVRCSPGSYPPGNLFPASNGAVGYTNESARNYLLTSGSPGKNAGHDGTDIGADIGAVNALTAGVVQVVTNGNGGWKAGTP